jgi:hypothetical protein
MEKEKKEKTKAKLSFGGRIWKNLTTIKNTGKPDPNARDKAGREFKKKKKK